MWNRPLTVLQKTGYSCDYKIICCIRLWNLYYFMKVLPTSIFLLQFQFFAFTIYYRLYYCCQIIFCFLFIKFNIITAFCDNYECRWTVRKTNKKKIIFPKFCWWLRKLNSEPVKFSWCTEKFTKYNSFSQQDENSKTEDLIIVTISL